MASTEPPNGRDSQGRKVGLSRRGNPSRRPLLTRIYGTLACLLVTLVLIAVVIVLQKILPDGSGSKFQPSWRRSVDVVPLARRDISSPPSPAAAVARSPAPIPPPTSTTLLTTPIPSVTPTSSTLTDLEDPSPLALRADIHPDGRNDLPCFTSRIECTRPRALAFVPMSNCSTTYIRTPCPTTTTRNPCIDTEVTCTTINRPDMEKRFQEITCSTAFRTTCHPTTSKSSTTSSTTPVSSDPCISTQVDCKTVDSRARLGKRQGFMETICATVVQRVCHSTTSTSTSSTITATPNPCISTEVACTTIDIPARLGKRFMETICSTSFHSICTSKSTSTSATTPTPNPCISTDVSCTTIDIPARLGKRQGFLETICSTAFHQVCQSTTSTSTSTSTMTTATPNPCISTEVACTTIDIPARLGKRQGFMETICSTAFHRVCRSTTSKSTSTSTRTTATPNPCISTEVACTTIDIPARLGKRQGFLETICSTSFHSICTSKSTSSSTTSVPITSTSRIPDPCTTSTVSCTTYEVPERLGRRYQRTDCATSFYSVTGCGVSTSSSSSSIPSVSTSSVSITPTSTPTITPSSIVDPCITSTVSCTTSVQIFKLGRRQDKISCVTSFSRLGDCPKTSSSSTTSITLGTTNSLSITSTSSPSTPPSLGTSTPSNSLPTLNPPSISPSLSIPGGITTPGSVSGPTSPGGTVSSNSQSASNPSLSSSASVVVPSGPAPSTATASNPVSVATPSAASSASPLVSTGSLVSAPTVASGSTTLPLPILIISSGSANPSLSSPAPPQSLLGSFTPTPPSGVTPSPGSLTNSLAAISSNSPPPSLLALLISSGSLPPSISPQVISPSATPSAVVTSPKSSPSITLSAVVSSLGSVPSASLSATASGHSDSTSVPSSLLTLSSNTATVSATGSAPNQVQSQQATTPGGGGGGGGDPTPPPANPINSKSDILPISQVVLGSYTPIIISRAFVFLLNALYQQSLTQEPIRQLTNPGGASASVMAGSSGSMIAVNIASIIAQIGSAFSAGATFVDNGYCDDALADSCPPRVSVNPWVLDVILATLIIQAIAISFVMSKWWRKPGSISTDPTTIAGVAVVMGHPEIDKEFSRFPAEITALELSRRLGGKRFKLGTFDTDRGTSKFGIVPAEVKKKKNSDGFLTKLGNWWWKVQNRFSILNWRKNRLYFDIIFVSLLLALLGLSIAAVSRIDKPQVVFLATAAASATGMRIFFAALGVIVSSHWGRLCQDMQTLSPYIDLGGGTAYAANTIALRRHSNPLTAFFPLLRSGHFTAASVALTGLGAELLVVALSGLPYRPGQLRGEFLFWGIISLAILSLMVAQLIIVNLWRRSLPHLPRSPNTIAAVMTYVAGTSMTHDFDGLEHLSISKRDRRIRDLGKSYAYGWRREEDGRVRWVIDEVAVDEHKSLIGETPADHRSLRDDNTAYDGGSLRDEFPVDEHGSLMSGAR